jgi:uncharacterized protein YeaO (DUF488 family)
MIRLKRAYDEPSDDDGYRILVDRLWPRGVSRERAAIDFWCREIAPSDGLRKWFGHDPERWDAFRERYRQELVEKSARIDEIRRMESRGLVTLVYAAKDEEHNNAVVIKELIEQG